MSESGKSDARLEELRRMLADHYIDTRRKFWGMSAKRDADFIFDRYWKGWVQERRVGKLKGVGIAPGCRILDLGAGYGHFVNRAVDHGYDCFGIEPDLWSLLFTRRKRAAVGLPAPCGIRTVAGAGEYIPFRDGSFDYVVSYQTLEHVDDPLKCIAEMIRVTRVDGGVYIECPDYRSTFEGHYCLPWMPLFPRRAARAYLRMLGRPVAGLDTLLYTTKPGIVRWVRRVERQHGYRLLLVDIDRSKFEGRLRRCGLPPLPGAFAVWRFLQWLKGLFRHEISISLFIRVLKK